MSHVQNEKVTVDQVANQHDGASLANPAPSSLFPAYAAASGQQATGWLQNASFPAMSALKQPEVGSAGQAARSKLMIPYISAPTFCHNFCDPRMNQTSCCLQQG